MTLLIGDSIGLSMQDDLKLYGIKVNAVVGRQFREGLEVVRDLRKKHRLHKKMVIELGTNGPIQPSDMEEMLALLGYRREVWWVNNYVPGHPYQNPNNRAIEVAADPGYLIRWKSMAVENPEWFATDPMHIHPNYYGQAKLATKIAEETGHA